VAGSSPEFSRAAKRSDSPHSKNGDNVMAEIEIRIPKDLGLSEEQRARLEESFQKQLADVIRGGSAEAKPDESRVETRAKSKSQIV
jgi:hypothetical protein